MTEIREDEYLDPADGLIHCRKCGGPTAKHSGIGPKRRARRVPFLTLSLSLSLSLTLSLSLVDECLDSGRTFVHQDSAYTPQMIATITRQQIGTVERAIKIFLQLGLMEQMQDGAFYMKIVIFAIVSHRQFSPLHGLAVAGRLRAFRGAG